MYLELMKNFLLADSNELMVVRLISASWAQKRLIPAFLTWYTSNIWKIFFSPIRANWWLLDSFRPPEPKNAWFLPFWHDVNVELMKNFLLADSSELMVVRLISAAWGQKRLIPNFLTWYTSNVWKIFFSPIRASWWLLDSFRPPEPKNVWFLLSRHDVRRVDEKHSSRPFERTFGCWTHFGHLSPNVWFLLFWHYVRRVDEKYSSCRFERTFGC